MEFSNKGKNFTAHNMPKPMELEIKDVVALTGTPGLHRIIKSDDQAIVVESLDERKRRQMIKGNMMVSKIMDISIYTEEDSEPLVKVLKSIEEKFGKDLPVVPKSSSADLLNFLGEVLPSFDRERVYPSNIKKLVGWYNILTSYGVAFEQEEADAAEVETTDVAEEKEVAVAEKAAAEPAKKKKKKD